jgi:hypothetical protein
VFLPYTNAQPFWFFHAFPTPDIGPPRDDVRRSGWRQVQQLTQRMEALRKDLSEALKAQAATREELREELRQQVGWGWAGAWAVM